MAAYLGLMKGYWDGRFAGESLIWGTAPSTTAEAALALFRARGAARLLVPGAGYGRNTRLFAAAGFQVDGIEISPEAVALARAHDPRTAFTCACVLDAPLASAAYDAVYCFNVLHLFRRPERALFVERCHRALRRGGLAYFAVFADTEKSFGQGRQVEENTFESKPGRPVHYFTDRDLRDHFALFAVRETGLAEDREDHGAEGPHTHVVRYIVAEKTE
jgi:SAM-dependent methyltransferase